MSNRKRTNMTSNARGPLPPIINEDDGVLPFVKQDFFSDVALIVQGKKLFTARCILAYNSPVFERSLANAKKHEVDMPNKNYDDVVELLCFLDPRVQYTITATTAKKLLPLSEEYELVKLRRQCEHILFQTYEKLRKDTKLGEIQSEITEEYMMIADRYGMEGLLKLCIEEYVSNPDITAAKTAANSETLSERVKLLILQKKLARLNHTLEKERRYRNEAELRASRLEPKQGWKKYWHTDDD